MSEEDLSKIIKDHFKIKDGNLSINIKDKIIKIFHVGVQYENKEEKPNFVIDVGSIKSSHEVKQDTYHVIFDKEKKEYYYPILNDYTFNFTNCIFEKQFQIASNTTPIIFKSFNFKNCIFKGSIYCVALQFSSLTFESCKFHSFTHFYNLYSKDASSKTAESTNDKAKLVFLNCVFSGKTFFDNIPDDSRFQVSIRLKKATFERDISFKNIEFANDVDFTEAKFKGEAKFEDTKFKNKVDFRCTEFENKVDFTGSEFEGEVDFSEAKFEKHTEFSNNIFKGKVNFRDAKFKNEIGFIKTNFESEVDFENISFNAETPFKKVAFSSAITLDDKFENNHLIFNEVVFDEIEIDKNFFKDKEVKFKNCTFKKNLSLSEIIFEKKISFATCTFKGDVYFDDSTFNNYAEFYASIFEKVASFYGAIFKKIPNFSTCYFKEPRATNLVGIDIGELDFNSVEKYIKDSKDKQKETKCARNLKDSFRTIKDILMIKNNILDAQEWHKLELYAQEKEIESKRKSSKSNAESNDENSISLWVNQHLLRLYRITSLHHTDFTRIFNFTVLTIILYGLFLFIVKTTLDYVTPNQLCPICFIVPALLLYCAIIVLSLYLYTFKSPYIISNPILMVIAIAFVVLLKPQLINPFIGAFSSDKFYESRLEKFLNNTDTNTIINLAEMLKNNPSPTQSDKTTLTKINAARTFISTNKEKINQLPKESHSTLQSNKNLIELSKAIYQDEIMSGIVKSSSILYSIILLLCIFSLQKTARKNSIIPS